MHWIIQLTQIHLSKNRGVKAEHAEGSWLILHKNGGGGGEFLHSPSIANPHFDIFSWSGGCDHTNSVVATLQPAKEESRDQHQNDSGEGEGGPSHGVIRDNGMIGPLVLEWNFWGQKWMMLEVRKVHLRLESPVCTHCEHGVWFFLVVQVWLWAVENCLVDSKGGSNRDQKDIVWAGLLVAVNC